MAVGEADHDQLELVRIGVKDTVRAFRLESALIESVRVECRGRGWRRGGRRSHLRQRLGRCAGRRRGRRGGQFPDDEVEMVNVFQNVGEVPILQSLFDGVDRRHGACGRGGVRSRRGSALGLPDAFQEGFDQAQQVLAAGIHLEAQPGSRRGDDSQRGRFRRGRWRRGHRNGRGGSGQGRGGLLGEGVGHGQQRSGGQSKRQEQSVGGAHGNLPFGAHQRFRC